MLREGPISPFLHGVIEYLGGIFFVAAPFLFDFDSGTAVACSIVIGIVFLVVAASSESPVGLARTIPPRLHALIDVVLALLLIAAPFLFGFADETAPTAVFIVAGIVLLLVTIGTRHLPPRQAAPTEPRQPSGPST